MGLRFRKSSKAGPFRVNFSKSGVGYSVGGKGFRFTKKANGGYRTTASIPGTGISSVNDFSGSKNKKYSFSSRLKTRKELTRKQKIVENCLIAFGIVSILTCFILLLVNSIIYG